MAILSKFTGTHTEPADEIGAAKAKLREIETKRQAQWSAFQRCLERSDELKAERGELLVSGDRVDLIRNQEATEAVIQLSQQHLEDYNSLSAPQMAAESAVRGAVGRRAPRRAQEIADEYAACIAGIADDAESARAKAERMAGLESETEHLFRTHGQTINALPLAGGAVSLRSTIEVNLIEPLQRYADAVERNRADADLAAHANKRWAEDRARAREQFTGDQDALGIESPSFPVSGIEWTEVTDEHGRRRLYPEDKQDNE
jgi:hypothetical protein